MAEEGVEETVVSLVGPHKSGKSTLHVQMQILFSLRHWETREIYRKRIRHNLCRATARLLRITNQAGVMVRQLVGEIDQRLYNTSGSIGDLPTNDLLKLRTDIQRLLSHQPIRDCFGRAVEFNLPLSDYDTFLLQHYSRILSLGYLPTSEDIFRGRYRHHRTACQLLINQRNIHLLGKDHLLSWRRSNTADVDCFLFCAALSTKDADGIRETFRSFHDECKTSHFNTIKVVLLTKIDDFRQSLLEVPLRNLFPEYTGDNSYDSAVEFISKLFWQVAAKAGVKSDLTIHPIRTLDEEDVRSVFKQINFIPDDIVPCHDYN